MSVIIFTLTNTLLAYKNIHKTLGLILNLVAIFKSKLIAFPGCYKSQTTGRLISSDYLSTPKPEITFTRIQMHHAAQKI